MSYQNWPLLKLRLACSKFRSGFKLKGKEKKYYLAKGKKIIKQHAYDFIKERLAPSQPPKDGRQTPMRGHPVFIAQHATATCCRKCLSKWHKIKPGQQLTNKQIDYTVDMVMHWLDEHFFNDLYDKETGQN